MSTKVNFIQQTKAVLQGSGVAAAGVIEAVSPEAGFIEALGSGGVVVDKFLADLSTAGYAKNGAAGFTLTGTTLVTLNLTNLATATTTNAGDTSFATWNLIHVFNTGAADLTIAPGATHPANLGISGTTPTVTVPAGSHVVLQNAAGGTVDSTHNTIDITPTSGGSVVISVGGA